MNLTEVEQERIDKLLKRVNRMTEMSPSSILVTGHSAKEQTVPLITFTSRTGYPDTTEVKLVLCPIHEPHWQAIQDLYRIAKRARKEGAQRWRL